MDHKETQNNLMPYSSEDGKISLDVIMKDDSIWATQKMIADLFDVNVPAISKHLNNIYEEKELEKDSTISKMEIVQFEGGREVKRPVDTYNLDAVIAVGYRVNSVRATQFRIWANAVLKQYIQDGYVINEALLRSDPEKRNKLAAKLRELRFEEKNVFESVRDAFKISASDYDSSSLLVRSFYIKLQEKFHHAITKMTASALILDRAEHSDINMGMTQDTGKLPKLSDAKIGKNYLREDELYRMHLLSEQFLLFAESTALRGKKLTMQELHDQLDKLLELNGYPVFDGYDNDFRLKERAMKHAEREFNQYLEIKQLEHLGVNVDLISYYDGEYEEYKFEASKIRIQDINKQLKAEKDALKIEDKTKKITPIDSQLKTALGFNPKD